MGFSHGCRTAFPVTPVLPAIGSSNCHPATRNCMLLCNGRHPLQPAEETAGLSSCISEEPKALKIIMSRPRKHPKECGTKPNRRLRLSIQCRRSRFRWQWASARDLCLGSTLRWAKDLGVFAIGSTFRARDLGVLALGTDPSCFDGAGPFSVARGSRIDMSSRRATCLRRKLIKNTLRSCPKPDLSKPNESPASLNSDARCRAE